MERYIVKPEDLKGEIADFPIEVVQRMVDCQVEQGNKADVSVFQKNKREGAYGGFHWGATIEGYVFWSIITGGKNFDVFFERYPKQSSLYTAIAEAVKSVVNADTSVEVEEKDGTVIIRAVEKKEDLPIDYPVMVNDELHIGSDWRLRYYAGERSCFLGNNKSYNKAEKFNNWTYIIPFDKFDPNNIEESLKHNIVKL